MNFKPQTTPFARSLECRENQSEISPFIALHDTERVPSLGKLQGASVEQRRAHTLGPNISVVKGCKNEGLKQYINE